MMVGCTLPGFAVLRNTSTQGNHGRILYNNKLWYAAYEKITTGEMLNQGLWNIQNLYEYDNTNGVTCMNFFADGDLTTVDNYGDVYNGAFGNRSCCTRNGCGCRGIGGNLATGQLCRQMLELGR